MKKVDTIQPWAMIYLLDVKLFFSPYADSAENEDFSILSIIHLF